MRKCIAHITLAVLLAVPAFSLISSLFPAERQGMEQALLLTLAGDLEDHQDDSDPLKDSASNQDVDVTEEKYPVLLLPVQILQRESRQEHLFKEYHAEIATPPPKN
jgi:hypothetical protein